MRKTDVCWGRLINVILLWFLVINYMDGYTSQSHFHFCFLEKGAQKGFMLHTTKDML